MLMHKLHFAEKLLPFWLADELFSRCVNIRSIFNSSIITKTVKLQLLSKMPEIMFRISQGVLLEVPIRFEFAAQKSYMVAFEHHILA